MKSDFSDFSRLGVHTLPPRSTACIKSTMDCKSISKLSDPGETTRVGIARWAATSSLTKWAPHRRNWKPKAIATTLATNDRWPNAHDAVHVALEPPSSTCEWPIVVNPSPLTALNTITLEKDVFLKHPSDLSLRSPPGQLTARLWRVKPILT